MSAIPKVVLPVSMAILICVSPFTYAAVSIVNAEISLSGQVEGEDGKPLERVRLHVRKNRVSLMAESFLSWDETTTDLADGRFAVDCRSCSSVELFFSKPGFYSESRTFHVGSSERSGDRVNPEEATDLLHADLRVTLRSSQNKTQLVTYSSLMMAGAHGPVTVAPLRRGLGRRVKPERLGEPLGSDERNLPGFIRLVATLTDEGTLAVIDPDALVRKPKLPILDFTEAGGGLILHRYAEGAPKQTYRAMSVAPEDGYQAHITLDTEGRSGGRYYFYCRIGNRYGKGRVSLPLISHDDAGQEVVQASIEVRLNLDGSRNLETAF